MGACASRPRDMDGEAPVELPVAEETAKNTVEVAPVEASSTTKAAVESSGNTGEKKDKEVEPSIDHAESEVEEPKSEESKSEVVTGEPEGKENVDVAKLETTEEKPAENEETIKAEPKQAS